MIRDIKFAITRVKPKRQPPSRNAFSLLEILLALAILGGSLAILSQIAQTGVVAAREARDLSMARMLAQSKLAEVLLDADAGQTPTSVYQLVAEPFDSQSTTSFTYSVEVQPAPLDGMLIVRVDVTAADGDDVAVAHYAVDRWLIDPAFGLAELAAEEQAARDAAAGTEPESGGES